MSKNISMKKFLRTRSTRQLWAMLRMHTRVNNWRMIFLIEAELKRRGIKLEEENGNS